MIQHFKTLFDGTRFSDEGHLASHKRFLAFVAFLFDLSLVFSLLDLVTFVLSHGDSVLNTPDQLS